MLQLPRRIRTLLKDKPKRNAAISQLIKFILIGGFATLIYVAGISWGVRIMKWPVIPVNAVFYALSTIAAYLGNYYWTFTSEAGHTYALSRYLVMSFVGLVSSSIFVWGLSRGIGLPVELAGILFAAMWPFASYLAQKYFVY